MTDELFKVYLEAGADGYPPEWHRCGVKDFDGKPAFFGIKDVVREQAGDRCLRCKHPYAKGMGEWSPCDPSCEHLGPVRYRDDHGKPWVEVELDPVGLCLDGSDFQDGVRWEARWRILTVHHLNGVKLDCRWWNLAALCQRCHLVIQGKVKLEREFVREHSQWFKPFAAGWYAHRYLNEDITREQTMARLDELLKLELAQEALF